jgi:non-ribosomal peptide synthase protein (TIGR01720 family)
VPNVFSAESGARLYRTGDMARYLPDGNIEFLGRIDNQIKIRGYRIEPGEIEAALSQHPSVRENVVMAREDTPGQKRLAAYIVAAQPPPSTTELREFLVRKLPDYMVPAAFVVLDALPMTPNGKIERNALPVPEQAQPDAGKTFVAPRTENEKMLSGIWSKVLRLKQVSVNDNFFALGGDSILSIQIIARANQAGLRLTPRQLFNHQTIAKLALVVDTAPATRDEQGTIVGAVPRTPIQHWFFERELKDVHHWNQSMLLECPEGLDAAVLEKVVEHLLSHHDALRLRFRKEAGQWQQLVSPDDERAPFMQFDLSGLPESEQVALAERAAEELQESLNLHVGPIMRAALFSFGAGRTGKLLIVIHHLAVDGVSWRILLEDLRSAYLQSIEGRTVRLPPKTTSFKRWAEQLEAYAQSESLRQETGFWLGELSKQTGRIPLDFAGGANTVALARHVSVSLSAEETQALLQDVPSAYRTQINDVLLTALMDAFWRWTGERSTLVEVEGHGREEIVEGVDLSRTVGWCTTRFPVLLEMDASSNPGDRLMSVKEHLRIIPHNGIGYGLLRYLSTDEESAGQFGRMPHPEVSFNYLGQFQEAQSDNDLFRAVSHARGSMRSPKDARRHLLDVNAIVTGGQLQVVWSYSSEIHREATIDGLTQDFLSSLRSLIEHCKSPGARGYTPSDFPLVNLNQKQLEKIFAKLGKQAKG